MDVAMTYEEMMEANKEEPLVRAHSFEAEKMQIIDSLERAYKMLAEKRSELQNMKHEAYCIDEDEEAEECQERKDLKEDIHDIYRFIKKLEREASEIDMLISCRDEKEEPAV